LFLDLSSSMFDRKKLNYLTQKPNCFTNTLFQVIDIQLPVL